MNMEEINKKLAGSPNGIWVDYDRGTFLFIVKDRVWQKDELHSAAHREVTVSFVSKGILDLFVLTIDDCLEPSDMPLCMKEADVGMIASMKETSQFRWQIVLADEHSRVLLSREGSFSAHDSAAMKTILLDRLNQDYSTEDFDHAYEKNAARYEPYMLEEQAVFTERSK